MNKVDGKEKRKELYIDAVKVFFVSTTFICVLCGVLGCLFWQDISLHMAAYFTPPIFGGISAFFSLVMNIGKDKIQSKWRIMLRKVVLLGLIEGSVFGLNYLCGNVFSLEVNVILFAAIAFVYCVIGVIIYLSDRKKADRFNFELQRFQEKKREY